MIGLRGGGMGAAALLCLASYSGASQQQALLSSFAVFCCLPAFAALHTPHTKDKCTH
jgi:hypothetical protein